MDESGANMEKTAIAPINLVRDVALREDDTEPRSLQNLRCAVSELFVALHEALRDERDKAAERLLRAEVLLGSFQPQAQPVSTLTPHGLAPWQIRRVSSYVDSHLNTPIRNRELAAIVRLSEFHFNVAFRRSFGDSPHAFIVRRRMERAQGLMLSTQMSLSAIAVECGLADQPHFSRLFRRFAGESPAAWRRARANPCG